MADLLDEARRDLARALNDPPAARRVLIDHGADACGAADRGMLSLHDVIRLAARAPATPARRDFAILLVHALAVDGLVSVRSNARQFDRDLCDFMESALPTVLRRFGYPFGGETYERRRSLERLHNSIDELLRPLEPTFPNWQGLYAG